MSGPHPSVATLRVHLRRALHTLPHGHRVLVACSGGADSMSLASALLFEGRRGRWRGGVISVDHQLQENSSQISERVSQWAVARGADPVEVVRVSVGREGGPEAAARESRYAALKAAAQKHNAVVLLGHTRDDQAETVLLSLARGSGARALSGMSPQRGVFYRPFLRVPRRVTREAALAEELPFWDDPHNAERRFARVRVRQMLTQWEAEHPGITEGLVRSADRARQDAEYLESVAAQEFSAACDESGALRVEVLEALPDALRTRVLHAWMLSLGSPAGAVSSKHIAALDALVTQWSGQGAVALPGRVHVQRRGGRINELQRALDEYRVRDLEECEEYAQGGPSAAEDWPEYQ